MQWLNRRRVKFNIHADPSAKTELEYLEVFANGVAVGRYPALRIETFWVWEYYGIASDRPRDF
jgi:hypothetical protein